MDYRSRILIVDDDIALLEQLEQALGKDYVVSLAVAGSQALSYLRSEHWVDIILLDVLMPDMDGYEVLEAIRKIPRYKTTPVIFLTSLSDVDYEVKGLQYGADYIVKPYTPIILKSRIERVLRMVGSLDSKKLEKIPQPLSEKEYYAAALLVQGYSNEEIAQMLHYTLGSVKNLLVRVMNKLAINSRTEIDQYKR